MCVFLLKKVFIIPNWLKTLIKVDHSDEHDDENKTHEREGGGGGWRGSQPFKNHFKAIMCLYMSTCFDCHMSCLRR